jgi:hypothetical protein
VTRRTKEFNTVQKWIKGEKPQTGKKKKNPHRGHGCLSVVSVVCCQVEVSATGWSLVQTNPTECGVSISVIVKRRKMTRTRPPKGCRAIGGKEYI